ncbi:Protein O-glucosyltransferase 3 [Picochlorum sp. SENEW3]|nr:Protein O-glucosyltransferase 3 [Picochlorum sp. SENEW3]WPT14967.1 Protein O-glucosyltransferase 3 [Picochlorum sp. SENEW3]
MDILLFALTIYAMCSGTAFSKDPVMFDGEFFESWRNASRVKLVQICAKHPDLCDARLTTIAQATQEAKNEILTEMGISNDTSPKRFLDYKYVIVADGNSAPSSRLALQLFGNSLIMLQETPWFEGYYRGLRPYVHYVPLSSSFLDLPDRVIWAKEHEQQVKQIVSMAQKFASDFLEYPKVLRAFAQLLIQYSKLIDRPRIEINKEFLEVKFDCQSVRGVLRSLGLAFRLIPLRLLKQGLRSYVAEILGSRPHWADCLKVKNIYRRGSQDERGNSKGYHNKKAAFYLLQKRLAESHALPVVALVHANNKYLTLCHPQKDTKMQNMLEKVIQYYQSLSNDGCMPKIKPNFSFLPPSLHVDSSCRLKRASNWSSGPNRRKKTPKTRDCQPPGDEWEAMEFVHEPGSLPWYCHAIKDPNGTGVAAFIKSDMYYKWAFADA